MDMEYQSRYDANFYTALFESVHLRHPSAAMPGFVSSPMDDRSTLTIRRAVVDACEQAAAAPLVDDEMGRAARGSGLSVRAVAG